MREFKFRSWDENREKMRSHKDLLSLTKECLGEDISPDIVLLPITQPHIKLMQCTGLKDKNDKEIYEYDILEYTSTFGGRTETRNILVSWSNEDGGYSFGGLRLGYVLRNSIVIGNVFENSELLMK